MVWLKRRESAAQAREREDAAIADFWSWWADEGKARAAAAFDGEGTEPLESLAEEIGRRTERIGLAFETGKGRTARQVLVVTAAGNPDLRDLARRWLAAAPPPDAAFEYADLRRPVEGVEHLRVRMNRADVDVASAVVSAEVADGMVHVLVWHPEFGKLSRDMRMQITFVFLDAVLGEDVVESRIGGVDVVEVGAGAVPLLDLPSVVEGLAASS